MMCNNKHFRLFLIWLFVLFTAFLFGCREKYVVGIVPVYTEESQNEKELNIYERLNIERGYREAVRESKRYNRTVSHLYLECKRFWNRYYDCSGLLTCRGGGEKNVKKFYADYHFQPKKKIQNFMRINGVNLLIISNYFWNREKDAYEIELVVFHLVPGSQESVEQSVVQRSDRYFVEGFRDFQLLKMMSQASMMRLMEQIEDANRY